MKLIAKTLQGLEPVLAQELQQLGARDVQILKRAVQFAGDLRLLYRSNLELRSAIRILWPIAAFRARHEDDLYRRIQRTDWSEYLNQRQTLAVDAITYSETFRHSKYVALKTKDAIVDQFRERTGRRPSVNVANPDLRINVHIRQNEVTVSIDSSGESLHKRGYRKETLEAPINEVLAAGILLRSGWRGERPLIDPMCGSGTFLVEAAAIASRAPAQWHRQQFAFQKWNNFDPQLWQELREAARAQQIDPPHAILGFDKSFQSIRVTQRNLEAAGLANHVEVKRRSFEKLVPPAEGGVLVANPPYDERLEVDDIEKLYRMIGDRLKQAFTGYEAWIISSNKAAIKSIGLKASARVPMFNGALECRLLHYELYEGSRKGEGK